MAVNGDEQAGRGPRAGGVPAAHETAYSTAGHTGLSLDDGLDALARTLARSTHAETVIVRLADEASGRLVARGLASESAALAAALEGTSIAPPPVDGDIARRDQLPEELKRIAERAGAESVLLVPVHAAGVLVGTIELFRASAPFGEGDRLLARVAASQAALLATPTNGRAGIVRPDALDVVGEALAATADAQRLRRTLARLVGRATGAHATVLWEQGDEGEPPEVVASHGLAAGADVTALAGLVDLDERELVRLDRGQDLPLESVAVATVRLGEPPLVLQLLFSELPDESLGSTLTRFAGRAGQALRAAARASDAAAELERTRALLGVVGQAIAELSLSHTLETAVARVGELLGTERVVVYLGQDRRLRPAAGRGLVEEDEDVAAALLRQALGPYRARGAVVVADAGADPRFARVREAVREADVEATIAVPLLALGDTIGLLVAYLPRGRRPTEDETALLVALAAQLGVAVQNARLHEEAMQLGAERKRALDAERRASRRLRAFYEVSQSFSSSLSLDETLEAVARTATELIDADAGVIRTYDRRRNQLTARAIYIADERLRPVLEPTLARPHRLDTEPVRQLVNARRPVLLTRSLAEGLGGAFEVFAPFLDHGASAAIIPIATAGELVAVLTVTSMDAERPIGEDSLEAVASLAAHAVLAVDNARLYQQQRHFLESMQRSLLPSSQPDVAGLELGHAYESSARLEVGGDVYDFLPLGEDRLAVILGDVTGHGVDAAADMAMAKFVFRSLARRHERPGALLAAANAVVVEEIAVGKFITMTEIVVNGQTGEVQCASAGHPAPLVVRRDGSVEELAARGVALGIEPGEEYPEETTTLAPGDGVVLYTDGVVEARCEGEQFGVERLDDVLREGAGLPAAELAAAVLERTREFAGGELVDDCAVVVVKRTRDASA